MPVSLPQTHATPDIGGEERVAQPPSLPGAPPVIRDRSATSARDHNPLLFLIRFSVSEGYKPALRL